jgi:ribosomal protein L31
MVLQGQYHKQYGRESRERGAGMNLLIGLILAAGLCFAGAAQGGESLNAEMIAALETESYIYVATRRLNGEWSSPAPVWFMFDEGAVYFTTSPTSHKAHRIHRGSPVRIWVGKKDGPFFEGEAKFIKERSVVERMSAAYSKKYWIAWIGFFRPRPSRVASGRTLAIRVTPPHGGP